MKKLFRSAEGQITIFFATTMLVVISFIAFIINIGIFVKAKINLQNAVDAAAFSGAAVQARQLTNIAYVNWEMRNVYKEWMFKYYVLGNLNIEDVANGASGNTNFTMAPYKLATNNAEDKYNVPSVCLDFAQAGGVSLCTNYTVAGLPRFEPVAVAGATDETLNTMMDTLVAEKGKDCANRSAINYSITALWAYNVKQNDSNALQLAAPQVASDRPGAFPTAFELALRMRNLEAQVNRAPYSGICYATNDFNKDFCTSKIEDVVASDRAASNERVLKAFYSGFRNLGSEEDTELRASFTLTELPPRPFITEIKNDLSTLLIPENAVNARKKYYLDLKLMTLNYATFFTQFTQTSGNVNVGGGGSSVTANTEGQCAATKTGLPVPGYPLGFVKNPDVLTYYAVKGQAKFIGLFNPFDISDSKGITLTALAAAKPFGGRIGPMLFDVTNSLSSAVKPRRTNGTSKFVSSAYTTGVNLNSLVNQYGQPADPKVYQPGSILPLSLGPGGDFWLSKPDQSVGGWVNEKELTFAAPNLTYDYPNESFGSDSSYFSQSDIQILDTSDPLGINAGLYNGDMFNKFAELLRNRGGNVQPKDVDDAVLMARAPTRYDMNNYLIPTPENINASIGVDSFGIITSEGAPIGDKGHIIYDLQLYAPLYADDSDSLFKEYGLVVEAIKGYLLAQEVAIQKYVESMKNTAEQIVNSPQSQSGATGKNLALESAYLIADHLKDPSSPLPSCNSLAGRFAFFYLGAYAIDIGMISNKGCAVNQGETLVEMMNQYFLERQDELKEFYYGKYVLPPGRGDNLFTAYRPGQSHDATGGIFTNFLRNTSNKMWRNFYSTKFSTVNSFLLNPKDTQASYTRGNFTTFSEGNYIIQAPTSQKQIVNGLDIQKVGVELKNIYH
jgi:Flp pilus assembly protein TadG